MALVERQTSVHQVKTSVLPYRPEIYCVLSPTVLDAERLLQNTVYRILCAFATERFVVVTLAVNA